MVPLTITGWCPFFGMIQPFSTPSSNCVTIPLKGQQSEMVYDLFSPFQKIVNLVRHFLYYHCKFVQNSFFQLLTRILFGLPEDDNGLLCNFKKWNVAHTFIISQHTVVPNKLCTLPRLYNSQHWLESFAIYFYFLKICWYIPLFLFYFFLLRTIH